MSVSKGKLKPDIAHKFVWHWYSTRNVITVLCLGHDTHRGLMLKTETNVQIGPMRTQAGTLLGEEFSILRFRQ